MLEDLNWERGVEIGFLEGSLNVVGGFQESTLGG